MSRLRASPGGSRQNPNPRTRGSRGRAAPPPRLSGRPAAATAAAATTRRRKAELREASSRQVLVPDWLWWARAPTPRPTPPFPFPRAPEGGAGVGGRAGAHLGPSSQGWLARSGTRAQTCGRGEATRPGPAPAGLAPLSLCL